MPKNLCRRTAQENYYNLITHLEISKENSKILIKSTHRCWGFWNYHPYAVEDLIKECKNKKYQGTVALDYIKSNYKEKALEMKSKIKSDLMKPEKSNF